jgi:hypothetical protein
MEILISTLWGIFTFVFFLLSIYYILMIRNNIEHFKIPTMSQNRHGDNADRMPESVFDKPFIDFQAGVNEFVNKLNKNNKKINFTTATGYLAAALTSGVSLLLSLR